MQYTLGELAPILEIRDASGAPCVIIGGQAVNFWAEKYLHAEPELLAFLPFVSKDIDFLGGRQEVLDAARLAWRRDFPTRR